MNASGIRLVLGALVALAFVALAVTAEAKTKKISTKATIAFTDLEPLTSTGADGLDSFSGEVKSKKKACEGKRKVKLFRGTDDLVLVGSTKSDGSGLWEFAIEDPGDGTYSAKVAKKRKGKKKLCKAGKSPQIEVEDAAVDPGDVDLDGFALPADCDDADTGRNPAAEEQRDGVDNDCDGLADDIDEDGDGFITGEDCDDSDPLRNPGAVEDGFDGVDDDCDGFSAPTAIDSDADGVESGLDCDDTDATVKPGAPEARNGIDDDCTGFSDDSDEDSDGFFVPGDCDDTDPGANPDAVEVTDGVDQNCDGAGS